jgi:hypothetical protein
MQYTIGLLPLYPLQHRKIKYYMKPTNSILAKMNSLYYYLSSEVDDDTESLKLVFDLLLFHHRKEKV